MPCSCHAVGNTDILILPIPSQTGMCRRDPRYDTKMTVMTFPISYMEAIMPEIELGISYRFSMVVMTEFK